MSNICHFCGNKNSTPKTVPYIYRQNDKMMVINNVPCEECDFCGERYYDGAVIEKIEAEFLSINNSHKIVKKSIIVPVEEYLEIAG